MAVRIPWEEHEEAILLHALINVLNHELERRQAISKVSMQLRALAETRGLVIDEKFRNENGIALQMSKLEYAFTNGESGLHVRGQVQRILPPLLQWQQHLRKTAFT